jgi:hypothetical protein
MGKKVYNNSDINFVKDLVRQGESVTKATKELCNKRKMPYTELIGRAMRRIMQKEGVTQNVKTIEDSDNFKDAQNKTHDRTKKRFLITWCQSETEVHKPFLLNMESYAEKIDAEILVIAGRYRNPTSLSSSKNIQAKEKNKGSSWDKLVLPYLDAARHKIHDHLVVLSDVKIQPTASMPLTSLNGLTGLESCIVGSPKSHMKFLPVLDGYPSKLLVTTGSVSLPNYTDTKVGKQSTFHHQIGCIVVELDEDIFHIRQIIAERDGSFYDLIHRVKDGIVTDVSDTIEVEVAVLGDIHLTAEDKDAVDKTFKMLEIFKPKKVILEDITDGGSISHHEKKNPFQLLRREQDGSNSVMSEINYMIDWFKGRPKYNYVIPAANHNDFIDRWLQTCDWRKEGNKAAYLEYAGITARGEAPRGIIAYILEKEFDHIKCLGVDESYNVMGWELSCHGDRGANGSRGSAIQFKNLNVKTVTAHTHSASKMDGHCCVGTLTMLRMGYNLGMSAWSVTNLLIYPNGKAQHVHLTRGKYTTFYIN